MVEQLEKVPTILDLLKQKVDIPVPRRGGLQGLRPGQSSTAAAQQNVATPAPRRGWCWTSSRFYAQDIVLQQLPSRTLPLQFRVVEVLVVVFKVSLRIRAPQRLFQFLSETLVKVFFALFPHPIKVVSARVHGHSSSSELSAHQMAPPDERTSMVDANGHAWVRLDTAPGSYWQNLDTRHTQWTALGALRCLRFSSSTSWWWRLSRGVHHHAPVHGNFCKYSVSCACSRCSHLKLGSNNNNNTIW